jgi:hypothetical protein
MGSHLDHNAKEFSGLNLVMISSINDTPLYKNKSFLHQKYVSEGFSPQQIASEIFSARITISKHLKKFEIPKREKDICQKSGRALGYGEMRKKWRNPIQER